MDEKEKEELRNEKLKNPSDAIKLYVEKGPVKFQIERLKKYNQFNFVRLKKDIYDLPVKFFEMIAAFGLIIADILNFIYQIVIIFLSPLILLIKWFTKSGRNFKRFIKEYKEKLNKNEER